jgi:hypothetical protein
MQPKDSPEYPSYGTLCRDCHRPEAEHDTTTLNPSCPEHGIVARLRARAVGAEPDFEERLDPACADCVRYRETNERLGCRYFVREHVNYPIRALVRYSALRQLGHFMMGFIRVGKHRLTVSGSYGADGLAMDVDADVYARGLVLPDELRRAWNEGGGWNGAGGEAAAMRRWAEGNLKALRG